MRTLSQGLTTHLAGGATTLSRCWRLQRTDGVVMGFTDHDKDIAFDGLTFAARTGLAATADVARTGLAVGGLEVEGALTSAGLEAADLARGLYDFAAVKLWLVNWTDPAERVLLRAGTLGEVRRQDGAFHAEVRGPMQALQTVRGRVVTTTCDADLGDARCGVSLPSLTVNTTVSAVEGLSVTVTGLSGKPAGWCSDGFAVVNSGAAAGARSAIARHGGSGGEAVLTLRDPLPGLAAGDGLAVQPGCDKRFSTCRLKFGNALNFQGFPHLPGNDRAFAYARTGS